jgi:hypothetical protein
MMIMKLMEEHIGRTSTIDLDNRDCYPIILQHITDGVRDKMALDLRESAT